MIDGNKMDQSLETPCLDQTSPPTGTEGKKTLPATLAQRIVNIVVVVVGLVIISSVIIPIMQESSYFRKEHKENQAYLELAENALKDQGQVCSKARLQSIKILNEGKLLGIECQGEQKRYEIKIDAAPKNSTAGEVLP